MLLFYMKASGVYFIHKVTCCGRCRLLLVTLDVTYVFHNVQLQQTAFLNENEVDVQLYIFVTHMSLGANSFVFIYLIMA